MSSFCALGDFNARSGHLSDFLQFNEYVADENFDLYTKITNNRIF